MAAFYVGRTLIAPLAGRLSDRFGPLPFLILGNSLLGVGLLWIGIQGTGASTLTLVSAMLVASAGSAFFEPVVTSVIMGSVPLDRLGTASAAVATGRQSAFAVGVAVAGAVFTVRERLYLGDQPAGATVDQVTAAEAIAAGFSDTVMAGVALAAIALAFSLPLRGFPVTGER